MASNTINTSESANIQPGKGSSTLQTILICDDLRDIVRVCSVFLRSKYNLLTAESGEECLSVYSREVNEGRKIDLILMDYRLGDMKGGDVARKIKNIQPTRVILMTAFELDPSTISSLREDKFIVSHIKKPFSLKELDRTIDSVITRN